MSWPGCSSASFLPSPITLISGNFCSVGVLYASVSACGYLVQELPGRSSGRQRHIRFFEAPRFCVSRIPVKRARRATPKVAKPNKKSSQPAPGPEPSKADSFPIVGIGASAGGLEAFKELLTNLPEKAGMAYVLVPHLDPAHHSVLTEILSRFTKIPIAEVLDGMRGRARSHLRDPAEQDDGDCRRQICA